MNKKFSILTTTYNRANCVRDWADSVLLQDYRPLEVVMVNDMSEDNTDEEVEAIKKDFNEKGIEFKYIKNTKKLYCASSYKEAMSNATGDYFGILDSDDMLAQRAVETVMKVYLEDDKIGFIYTQFDWCNRKGKKVRKGFCRAPKRKTSLLDSELSSYSRHCFSHWRTCKRMPNIMSIWKDGLKVSVDKHMGYRLEELGRGVFLNKICYRYREGMKYCVTRNEKPIETWHAVREEAQKRRKKNGIKPFPVVEI